MATLPAGWCCDGYSATWPTGRLTMGEPRKLADVAAQSAKILLDTETWIHRRVYKIGYTDSGLMLTNVSVDLTVDPRLVPFLDGAGSEPSVFFAPIMMLRKWPPLMRFDLRSQEGCPLPLLTSGKNREVDAAVLEMLAPAGDLKVAAAPTLRQIATSDKAEATARVNALGKVVLDAAPGLSMQDRKDWIQTLLVASSLASNSLLWARVTGKHRDRIIVKVAFEDRTRRELVLSRRVFASLSWAPTRLVVTFPNAGEGRSFHVQVDPPPELRIHRARLLLANPLEDEETTPRKLSFAKRAGSLWWGFKNTIRWRVGNLLSSAPAAAVERDRLQPEERRPGDGDPYYWETPERAYLYVTGSRRQAAVVEVDMAVHERNGLKSAAVGTSAAITGLMTYFLVAAGEVTSHVDAAVTLFVLVPALLGYLVVRPGEHPLLRKHLSGVRLLLLLAGASPVFAAAVMLGWVHPNGSDVFWYWFALAVFSWIVTGLLLISWLLPLIKDPYPERTRAR
jgi:hypothetical protein